MKKIVITLMILFTFSSLFPFDLTLKQIKFSNTHITSGNVLGVKVILPDYSEGYMYLLENETGRIILNDTLTFRYGITLNLNEDEDSVLLSIYKLPIKNDEKNKELNNFIELPEKMHEEIIELNTPFQFTQKMPFPITFEWVDIEKDVIKNWKEKNVNSIDIFSNSVGSGNEFWMIYASATIYTSNNKQCKGHGYVNELKHLPHFNNMLKKLEI